MGDDLRKNQALLESFMENATDRFYILDENLNIVAVNDTVIKRWEFDPARKKEIVGKNLIEIFPGIANTSIPEHCGYVLETGEPYSSIDRSIELDQIQFKIFKIVDGIGIIVTEITDLITYQKRLEALHACSTRLVQANDLVQIAAITVESLHQVLGDVFGEVGFVEDDRFVWYGSTEREFAERPSIPLDSRSIIVRAIKTKETQLVPDVSEDPDYTILNVPEGDSVRMSELSVPVLVDDEAVGALNVESSLVDDFTQDDVRILETLAQSVSSAFGRLRADQTRARQSIELTYRLNNLEPGDSYICESHDRCYKVFAELSMHGVPGLCIVRDDPTKLVERYSLDRESVLLLASRSIRGFSAVNDLQEISLTFSKTLKEAHEPIILLDGIEYMITMFGFERVFNFLQEKKFDILEAEAILLLPIDTMTLNDQQKALLSSELKTLT
jgi:hypothetical protein